MLSTLLPAKQQEIQILAIKMLQKLNVKERKRQNRGLDLRVLSPHFAEQGLLPHPRESLSISICPAVTEMDDGGAGNVLSGWGCPPRRKLEALGAPDEDVRACLTHQLFCWGTGGSCHPPATQEPPRSCPKGSQALVALSLPAKKAGPIGNLPREKLQEAFFWGGHGVKRRENNQDV